MKKIISVLILLFFVCFLTGCDKLGSLFTKTELAISINSGVDTVEVFTNFEDKGATATYGSQIVAVATKSDVDTSKVGVYTVTYTATLDGKTVTAVRKVSVVDQTSPIISLNPGVDTVFVGGKWTDAGVTARDNSNEEVKITVEGNVNTSTAGEYKITYTATDNSGNESQAYRYVNVLVK